MLFISCCKHFIRLKLLFKLKQFFIFLNGQDKHRLNNFINVTKYRPHASFLCSSILLLLPKVYSWCFYSWFSISNETNKQNWKLSPSTVNRQNGLVEVDWFSLMRYFLSFIQNEPTFQVLQYAERIPVFIFMFRATSNDVWPSCTDGLSTLSLQLCFGIKFIIWQF